MTASAGSARCCQVWTEGHSSLRVPAYVFRQLPLVINILIKTAVGLSTMQRLRRNVAILQRQSLRRLLGKGKHRFNHLLELSSEKSFTFVSLVAPQPAPTPLSLLSARAVETAKAARSHAMDVRIHKKKPNPLHTTAALNQARASVSTLAAVDKISVSVEVRIKDVAKRTSMSTDPTFGKWARLWEKDVYLSRTSLSL